MFKPWDFQEPDDPFHKVEFFWQEEKKVETKKENATFFLALFLLFIILSPLFISLYSLFSVYLDFRRVKEAVETQDFMKIEERSRNFRVSLEKAISGLEIAAPAFRLFGLEEKFTAMENLFYSAKEVNEILYESSLVAKDGERILRKVLSSEEVSFSEEIPAVKSRLDKVFEEVSLLGGRLENFSGQEMLVGSYISQAKNTLPKARQVLSISREVLDILPNFLGEGGRKTYLILFQNNSEIRPTGGFIGSFGILTFENGKLLDFEVHDVYFADGQLKGHVEPPAKLKEFLGQASWYLRDSNWDPDFPASAQRAAWFFEKETGRQVDGVIGINLTVAERILEAIGEIDLPDYREKISSKNFFEKAEYFSEAGFFPGSTGKQDFLGQVSRVIFEKIKSADQKTLLKIGHAFLTSLEEKEVTVFVNNEAVSQVLARLNWDGAIKRVKCEDQSRACQGDYLMIVEANVGVNKSNYFLKRDLVQTIKIGEDGKVAERLTIYYENQSPSEIFPAGRYKTYLRIYVPEGSALEACKIEDEDCGIEETTEHGRSVFGFLVEVPVREKRRVEISWRPAFSFEEGEYMLLIQKQPGIKREKFDLSILFPENLLLNSSLPQGLTGRGSVVYNRQLSSDLIFKLNFRKG